MKIRRGNVPIKIKRNHPGEVLNYHSHSGWLNETNGENQECLLLTPLTVHTNDSVNPTSVQHVIPHQLHQ